MRIKILGTPMAKQSARFFKNNGRMMSYQPKEIVEWKSSVQLQLKQCLPQDFTLLPSPVILTKLHFIFPELKSFTKKKKEHIKEGGHIDKTTKPDIDNLMKNFFDACNGILWRDDAEISSIQNIKKIYGSQPGIILEVYDNEI